jgi:hypothetical protein
MEVEDLQVLCLPHLDRDTVDAVLYDPMPGGSGLLEQMLEHWLQLLEAAKALLNCPTGCQTACIDCMLHFRNAHFQRHLNRHQALACLTEWVSLEPAQPIPAQLPTSKSADAAEPSHRPEFRLRDMLVRAGLGEPEMQKPIAIGPPWGRTIPDFFYASPDERHAGVCIYLDGLSAHIHGSAESRERDLQIRECLSGMDYEVVPIPKTALDDRDRMAGLLSRIARKLLTRAEAERIKSDSNWFTS